MQLRKLSVGIVLNLDFPSTRPSSLATESILKIVNWLLLPSMFGSPQCADWLTRLQTQVY
jgi:hypothetical protein